LLKTTLFRVNVAPEATSNRRKSELLDLELRWMVWPLPLMVRLSPEAITGRPLKPSVLLLAVDSK